MTLSNADKLIGKLAQADYDDLYKRIESGAYLGAMVIEFPSLWQEHCKEDLERAAGRAPDGFKFARHRPIDFEKITARIVKAAGRKRR